MNGGAVSSAVEHVVDIDGVAGSTPAPPTTPEIEITVLDLVHRHRFKAVAVDRKVSAGYIYVIEAIGLKRFKIGITEDLGSRFPRYATECPVECRPVIVATVPVMSLRSIEKKLHKHYASKRVRGEWFDLVDDDIASFPDVLRSVARRPLADLTRELNQFKPAWMRREWEWKRQIEKKIAGDPAPTDDLVVDALDFAAEKNEVGVRFTSIKRQLRERDDVYQVVMSLIRRGVVAIVMPDRCEETGQFSLASLDRATICRPRWGCDWETSMEGVDAIVCESAESIDRVLSLVSSRNPRW